MAELKQRAKTDILILTPRLFLEGAQIHLGADFNPETYQEVDRIADEDLAEAHGAEDDPGKERHISADSLVATALQGSQRVSRRLDKRLMRLVDEREMLRAALAAAGSAQADSTPDNRSYRRAIEMRIDLLERRIESLGIEIERSGQP
ncbi:hypothetical protein LQ51_03335 [Micromonospora sp. HK10]|nr:hypothetical protein LQ51_03335 [Micromonospora sp. HK10]